ncbi:MAG TPA: cupin domain-containing protein [Clostridia bacterium]|nr:cupin domain-containing protein [Clostridia bacterium]
MYDSIHVKAADVEPRHRSGLDKYEYDVRPLIPRGHARQCNIALYEIAPGKSAYPYHYHVKNEESFYILSGQGLLRTPEGERAVSAGDFIFFPAGEKGAHKLTNASGTEKLTYLDFDTYNDLDVAFYPDSGKIGVWGMDINQLHKVENQVDYYLDE